MSRKLAVDALQLVQVTMKLLPRDGAWAVEFGSSSPLLDPRSGNFDFSGVGEAMVCISLVESPGCRFPANADACIGFAKKACPTDPNGRDHDVFQYIAVSSDGRGLCFLNRNRGGSYYYSLFVERGGETIVVDPKIINR